MAYAAWYVTISEGLLYHGSLTGHSFTFSSGAVAWAAKVWVLRNKRLYREYLAPDPRGQTGVYVWREGQVQVGDYLELGVLQAEPVPQIDMRYVRVTARERHRLQVRSASAPTSKDVAITDEAAEGYAVAAGPPLDVRGLHMLRAPKRRNVGAL